MSAAAIRPGLLGRLSFGAAERHHGLQLAAAVLLAFGLSMTLGLPERAWAVMSSLIVMRPSVGATLDAGVDRALGTLAGALTGLLGVYLEHLGLGELASTLSIVALLSFASAAAATLRSAPVAALIVLAAGALPGHSPLQAAGLRVLQIGIGIAVALGVALVSSRYRAPARLRAGCAALLGRLALSFASPGPGPHPGEADAAQRQAALRDALARLTLLALHADRESGLFFRRAARPAGAPADPRQHRRLAEVIGRVLQDVAVLQRLLRALPQEAEPTTASQARKAVGTALSAVAHSMADTGADPGTVSPVPAALQALRQFAEPAAHADAAAAGCNGSALLAAPLRLLWEDLQSLHRGLAPMPRPDSAA